MVKRGRPHKQIKLSLAKAVSQTLEKRVKNGTLLRDAGAYCFNLLTLKDQRDLGEQECWARLKDAMKRGRDSANGAAATRQACFAGFELFMAYTLDLDGERMIKRTEELRQLEFKRAITVRKDQLEMDKKALDALERAYKAVEPIWNDNPELTFGEICKIYRERMGAAA